jgi:hypothetical protein
VARNNEYNRMKKLITTSFLGILIFTMTFSCGNTKSNNEKINIESENSVIEKVQNDSSEIIDSWLSLGLNEEIIIKKLGEPVERGIEEFWEATGTYNQEWKFESIGIILGMESESEKGKKTVCSITLINPCSLKTSKSIGIGSEYQEVYNRYSKFIDTEFSSEENIVVGSIYGGTIFSFKNLKVDRIFIGAAAE